MFYSVKNVYVIGHSPIGAFQDQWVKNPNWWEADQLANYKSTREVELGATVNNIS